MTSRLLNLLAGVIATLNLFGGVTATIWLAIAGQWWVITLGVAGLFVSTLVLSLAILPALALAAPAVIAENRGYTRVAIAFTALPIIYTNAVITAWCVGVMYYLTSRAASGLIFPMLLAAYSIATGPIAYMAQKEAQGGNDAALMPTMFSCLAFIVCSIVVMLGQPSLGLIIIIFGLTMAVCGTLQFLMVAETSSAEARLARSLRDR